MKCCCIYSGKKNPRKKYVEKLSDKRIYHKFVNLSLSPQWRIARTRTSHQAITKNSLRMRSLSFALDSTSFGWTFLLSTIEINPKPIKRSQTKQKQKEILKNIPYRFLESPQRIQEMWWKIIINLSSETITSEMLLKFYFSFTGVLVELVELAADSDSVVLLTLSMS